MANSPGWSSLAKLPTVWCWSGSIPESPPWFSRPLSSHFPLWCPADEAPACSYPSFSPVRERQDLFCELILMTFKICVFSNCFKRYFSHLDQKEWHTVGFKRPGQLHVADFSLDFSHVLTVFVSLQEQMQENKSSFILENCQSCTPHSLTLCTWKILFSPLFLMYSLGRNSFKLQGEKV